MTKALIFDFDGVIVLSEQGRFRAVQQLSARYGVAIRDELFECIAGRTTADFFRLFLPDLDRKVLRNILDDLQHEYRDKIVAHVTPIAVTTEFIKTYSGAMKLAVASGSNTAVLTAVLAHLGIAGKFSCVVGKEQVSRHKPDPQTYLLAAKQLGCLPQDCIVIEDSVVGAQAARHAGMAVYILLNGANSRNEFESMAISGFVETTRQLRCITSA